MSARCPLISTFHCISQFAEAFFFFFFLLIKSPNCDFDWAVVGSCISHSFNIYIFFLRQWLTYFELFCKLPFTQICTDSSKFIRFRWGYWQNHPRKNKELLEEKKMIMRIGRETHTRKKTYIDCILTASCHVVVFSVKKNEKKRTKMCVH